MILASALEKLEKVRADKYERCGETMYELEDRFVCMNKKSCGPMRFKLRNK